MAAVSVSPDAPARRRRAVPRLPRLLAGVRPGVASVSLSDHLDLHGPAAATSLDVIARSGLRGRGGAGFPVAAKMRAVLNARGRAVVVANGAASDPLSEKDAFLLARVPHLVLDGAQLAAQLVRAKRIYLYVVAVDSILTTVRYALSERSRRGLDRVPVSLATAPDTYVAGEASAIVHALSGGAAVPTFRPPRMAERGVGRRPTLVHNVETLANLGLLARHDAEWFREVGPAEEPGSIVITVHGHDGGPAVTEVPIATTIGQVLEATRWSRVPTAVLVGGASGRWLRADVAVETPLSHDGLAAVGGALGVASLMVLHDQECGLTETARLARFLAAETAGQCGPCINGLPAIATTLAALVGGGADDRDVDRLKKWCGILPGRGACGHPDDTAGLVASGLSVFADDIPWHLRGSCRHAADGNGR
jgi:NADH:ubiquinone oxidoreductase subunit F (NADH-binding)